ncbi:MAG: MBL fold metallo-hydrolase [Clostridia bacterium]|nr:MBL fold metallo-hydrolase [Clostridia bacterium]
MKAYKYKIKNLINDKNALIRAIFIVVLVVFMLFVFVNQTLINFTFNGFLEIFSKDLQVYILDVGQANSNLIIFPNDTCMIIDTGSEESEDDFLKSVDTILSSNQITEIEYLLLTHSDADHVGGAVALLENYQVNNILRPKIKSKNENDENNYLVATTYTYANVIDAVYSEPNCNVEYIENKTFSFANNSSLTIYAGEEDYYKDTNSYSPFVLLDYKGRSFMFTGDATLVREDEFVDSFDSDISVDYLVVSHHGSKYSTTEKFLSKVKPKCALISAGDNLHPSEEVLKRLKNFGVEDIFVTKSVGTIALGVANDGKVSVKTLSNHVDLPLIVVVFGLFICVCIKCFTEKSENKFILRQEKHYLYHKKVCNKKSL